MVRSLESEKTVLTIGTRERDGVVILDVSGKLVGGPESDPLRETLRRIAEAGSGKVVVNLRGVPWMNSSGLGVLLAGFIQLRKQGGELKFAGLQERVHAILTTTKLVTMIETCPDEDVAVRRFQAR
jgi:anti-sigma B factor antagonist